MLNYIVPVIIIAVCIYILIEFKKILVEMNKIINLLVDFQHDLNDGQLSDYEKECLARQRDFDDRIELLRNELDSRSRSTPAEEKDGVYNLPHAIIDAYYDVKGEEVAI